MNNSLLNIEKLRVKYKLNNETIKGVNDVSFSIKKGESLGIIGESGSGKTSIAMAIMGLVKEPAEVKGNIIFHGKNINGLEKNN